MDWREKYKDKIVYSAADAVKIIKSGERVMIQQSHGETLDFIQALMDRSEELENVQVQTNLHWGPADYLTEEKRKTFKAISNFLGDNQRKAYQAGKMEFLPVAYHQLEAYYETTWRPDVFMLMVTPPDENGVCSFGMNVDYTDTAARAATKLIVQVNASLPFTYGKEFSLDSATVIFEKDEPLKEVIMGQSGEKETRMAEFIAPLIRDGDCLQLGIGGVPDAVLGFLHDKKDLGIHSELLCDGVVDLFNEGVVNNSKKTLHPGKMVSNFLIGSKKLFEFVDHNENVLLMPARYTNDPMVIAQNDNMISINACLQVDLYGQVASDSLDGKQYSGVGGQLDFVRGAQMSKGGKSILTLKSTALKDAVSNIVCKFGPGALITTGRYDVQYICSEYGIVNIHGLSTSDRAKALISIAHPKFREQLEQEAWEAHIITY